MTLAHLLGGNRLPKVEVGEGDYVKAVGRRSRQWVTRALVETWGAVARALPYSEFTILECIGGTAAGKGPYSHPVTRPHTLVTPINPTPSIPQHQPARPSNFWVSWSTWWLGDWLVGYNFSHLIQEDLESPTIDLKGCQKS